MSWSAIEEYNRRWHEVQYRQEHPEINSAPFQFEEELRRSFEHKGFNFTILENPVEVMKEGENLRHCVVDYVPQVLTGNYLVYKVEGHERATVGYTKLLTGNWMLDQARGQFNAKVSAGLLNAANVLAKHMSYIPFSPERTSRSLPAEEPGPF